MSKFSALEMWNEIFGKQEEAYDYAGRLMKKAACGNPYSRYEPTIDHIRPRAKGGKDTRSNIILCHSYTNEEKGNAFPHFKANGRRFRVEKYKASNPTRKYTIIEEKGDL